MRSFGPYTNLAEIGRGGMAVVYRATAPDGRLVALKLLPPYLAADATLRARFVQESNLGLDHPNIVRVNRSGVIDGTPYIEMEYVAGESLDRLVMRSGPLAPESLARILLDVGRALDYAHARGVIHRDVKPSNVIVRADGGATLADFGVAKMAGITAYTATLARVGSVFFMSPEQAAGAFEITPASDIYSLGATAYYALTGHAPFEAGSDVAIARQHIEAPPRHVSDLRPGIPRAVGDVVLWALQKAPSQRPASAGAFARSFAAALNAPTPIQPNLPLSRQPPRQTAQPPAAAVGAPASVDEWIERRGRTPPWLLAVLAGTVTLACLAVLATVILALTTNRSAPQAAPTRATPTAARPMLQIFTVEQAETPTVAPPPTLAPTPQQPTVPAFPAPLATATPPIVIPSPKPTRGVPATRAPITPLAPITSDATPPPPTVLPPSPTALSPPPSAESPLPTPGVVLVTTAP